MTLNERNRKVIDSLKKENAMLKAQLAKYEGPNRKIGVAQIIAQAFQGRLDDIHVFIDNVKELEEYVFSSEETDQIED